MVVLIFFHLIGQEESQFLVQTSHRPSVIEQALSVCRLIPNGFIFIARRQSPFRNRERRDCRRDHNRFGPVHFLFDCCRQGDWDFENNNRPSSYSFVAMPLLQSIPPHPDVQMRGYFWSFHHWVFDSSSSYQIPLWTYCMKSLRI